MCFLWHYCGDVSMFPNFRNYLETMARIIKYTVKQVVISKDGPKSWGLPTSIHGLRQHAVTLFFRIGFACCLCGLRQKWWDQSAAVGHQEGREAKTPAVIVSHSGNQHEHTRSNGRGGTSCSPRSIRFFGCFAFHQDQITSCQPD